MIIGISGKAQNGKDALAMELQLLFGFRRAAYADALKAAAAEVFGFSHEQLYGGEKEQPDAYWKMTPRDVLQRFGTEAMRQVFGADIWVKALMRRLQELPLADWVIPDVRFPNEAEAIKEAGGFVVRIERPGMTIGAGAAHVSETALDNWPDFDARIRNDGSLNALEDKAAQLYLWALERSAANDDVEVRTRAVLEI